MAEQRPGDTYNSVSGGVHFGAVVQGRQVSLRLPPAVEPALSGLPKPASGFVGRDAHVRELLEALAPERPQEAVPVAAVAGLAGAGKTELVVQTATRALARDGWFPGGVLFADLNGYDAERRLTAQQVLDGWLRALGVPPEHIPDAEQDRVRLYRSVLAAHAAQGRRLLVVIDNAGADDQARPLLPTDGTTAALVTSRHTLDIGARLHDLPVLDGAESVQLLRQALREARGPDGGRRIDDEPDAAGRLAELCAGLPLALRIVAALLADIPSRPVASLVAALEDAQTRLDRLSRADRAVRAAFALSYQGLPGAQARLFRLLALNPGPEISTAAAAALSEAAADGTEGVLGDLVRAHLVEPAPVWGRWRLHDLIRLYADEQGVRQADEDGRDAAYLRLLDHYTTGARAACCHLMPDVFSSLAGNADLFPDLRTALAWLDAERDNLVAAVTTAGTAHASLRVTTASVLEPFLSLRRHHDDWLATTTAAVDLCRAIGRRDREGWALNSRATALTVLHRFDEAADTLTSVLALQRSTGDRQGEGRALTSLGALHLEAHRWDEAVETLTAAIAVHRETGERYGECKALSNLGTSLFAAGRPTDAVDILTRAADLARSLGERRGEAVILTNLGNALGVLGRHDAAVEALTDAIARYEALGDHHGVGMAQNNLGNQLRALGRSDDAARAFSVAAELLGQAGDRFNWLKATTNLVQLQQP